jgi:hypothetical protein
MTMSVKTVDNGRTPGGRFALGNAFARGNPNTRRMHELRHALLAAVRPEDVQAVGAKLLELARAGDIQAARLWLEFVVGKPSQAIELSGPEGEPVGLDWDRLQTTLLTALTRFPEARVEVAMALRGLGDARIGSAKPDGDGVGCREHDGGAGP